MPNISALALFGAGFKSFLGNCSREKKTKLGFKLLIFLDIFLGSCYNEFSSRLKSGFFTLEKDRILGRKGKSF